MKKDMQPSKLMLSRESLRTLNAAEPLREVKGGYLWGPTQTTCGSAQC
jgi:hypothetical protein